MAQTDNSMDKVITQVLKYDPILIDEIRFAPMDTTAAELLFRLLAATHCHRASGSTGPSRSGKILPGTPPLLV